MKICPRCGSENVDWIIPQNWSVWECKNCDYTGPIIEGDKKLAEEIKKDYEEKLKHSKNRNEEIKTNESSYTQDNCEENLSDEEANEKDLSDEEIERRLDALDI